MSDTGDANLKDDFQLEITDLPPDVGSSISSALLERGSQLVSKARVWQLPKKPANDSERGGTKDDFKLEIIDLPPEEGRSIPSALLNRSSQFVSRIPIWRLVKTGSPLLLVLLIIFGSLSPVRDSVFNLFVHPMPAPTSASSSSIGIVSAGESVTVVVSGDGGPVPQDCPPGSIVDSSGEVGNSPVWIHGFDGPRAVKHFRSTSASAIDTLEGWATSILVIVKSDYTGTVMLHGKDLRNGLPLLFGLDNGQIPLTTLMLDTQHPSASPIQSANGQRLSWNVYLYIPAPGCYYLDASWSGGAWRVNFAAGD